MCSQIIREDFLAFDAEFLRAPPPLSGSMDNCEQGVYGWRIESRRARAENRTRARHSDSGNKTFP